MNKLLTLASMLFLASACNSPEPYEPELIYASDRIDGKLGIFATDTSGTDIRTVFYDTTATAYGFQWAPGGDDILFTRYLPDNREAYRFRISDSSLTNMSNHPAAEGSPQLSPDGSLFAFTSTRDHEKPEVYISTPEKDDARRLTRNDEYDMGIRFSPDNRYLTYCRQVAPAETEGAPSNGEIFIYNLETDEERRLTDKPGFDCLPDWSPDGNKIVFHGCESNGCNIYSINTDGSGLSRLTGDEYDDRWPRWSPDGKWIAYTSVRNGQSDIYIMKPDGSSKKQVTTHSGRDEIAEWKPMN